MVRRGGLPDRPAPARAAQVLCYGDGVDRRGRLPRVPKVAYAPRGDVSVIERVRSTGPGSRAGSGPLPNARAYSGHRDRSFRAS